MVKYKYKKNITRKKKFNKLKCAPKMTSKINKELQNISCYSSEDLLLMKKSWNENNSKKIISDNPKKIWNFLKNNLNDKCYNELCWLRDNNLENMNKEYLIKNTFRPFSPKGWNNKPYTWLSSIDIIKVMKQYEEKYYCFKFIGPSAIDFDDIINNKCVFSDLCNFSLSNHIKMYPKKKKIGIILNLDPHYKGGSHWVAIFINIKKQFIFYFDSNGSNVPLRVKKFINRVQNQANNMNIKLNYYNNVNIVHQKKDGQCGMYVLYFIVQLLRELKQPKYFITNRISDEEMRDYRKKYFNSSELKD
tara:strand:+ start:1596 stop:2507 length:912 start_codon:yes stop_codon:yes gene_type:complete